MSRQRVCECLSFKLGLNASTCCAKSEYWPKHVAQPLYMNMSCLHQHCYTTSINEYVAHQVFIALTPIYIRPKVLRRIKKEIIVSW